MNFLTAAKELKEAQAQLAAKDAALTEANTKLTEATANAEALNKSLTEAAGKIETLESQLKAANESVAKLESEKAEAVKKVDEIAAAKAAQTVAAIGHQPVKAVAGEADNSTDAILKAYSEEKDPVKKTAIYRKHENVFRSNFKPTRN